jgi:hypothetical protein
LHGHGRVIDECRVVLPELEAMLESPMLQDLPLETAPSLRVAQIGSEVLASLGMAAEPVGVPVAMPANWLVPECRASFVACDQVNQAVEF